MLLTLLVAIVAQSIDPVEAGCRLTAHGIEGRRTAPTSLSVECPRDVVDADYLHGERVKAGQRYPGSSSFLSPYKSRPAWLNEEAGNRPALTPSGRTGEACL